jgi:hypothetical protein
LGIRAERFFNEDSSLAYVVADAGASCRPSRPGTIHRFINTTDVVAAIEDILGLGRLSKFDHFSRPLTDVFAATPDLTPWSAAPPTADLNAINSYGAAAKMSGSLDFSAPDRINDAEFNQILWTMIKGGQPAPAITSKSPLHVFQLGR